MISLIAAIGENRELGLGNELIFHIPEDMAYFKETTLGHPVLMGRKTFESIGRPLPKRDNYVVTRHPEDLPSGVTPVSDLQEFLETHTDTPEEIFVIGGGMVYFEALPYAKNLYLTEVAAARTADTFFPAFDKSAYTRKVIKKGQDNDLMYTFVVYTKL